MRTEVLLLLLGCRAGEHHRVNGDGGADRSRWARRWAGESNPATGMSPIREPEADGMLHRGFIIIARMSGRLAPPGERRWWGRQVALGAAMGRRKQSGDRNVADPGAGGGRNASPRFYYYC